MRTNVNNTYLSMSDASICQAIGHEMMDLVELLLAYKENSAQSIVV